MAEIATIARPYAEALFQASQGQFEIVQDWLQVASQVAADAQLQALAADPQVTDAQVMEVFMAVLGQAQVASEQASHFLKLVIANKRVTVLPEIAKQVRELVSNQQGVRDAMVYSAFTMDEATLQDLKVDLEKRFSCKLNISTQLDNELIGGVRVVVGDEVLDLSIRAHLDRMKTALMA